ncbi:Beta,beta-carotene 15,15'-dioxygenase [Halotydeus destructor]|nr:Beta,beta-carotene 15,15'-dioxygenase [Halotydeus destructor]
MSLKKLVTGRKLALRAKSEEKDNSELEESLRLKWKRNTFGFFDPFLRNCTKERDAIECIVTGTMPRWLSGTLLRNGPGMRKVGKHEYKHLFDGMALMQMFKIEKGKVIYKNKFLKSDSYRRNMKAQRIVVTEFGTRSHRDPCMTLFERMSNYFLCAEVFSDNNVVSYYNIGDELYAVSDTPFIRRIDPQSLKTYEKVDLRNYVAVNTSTSHPHTDSQGNTYNMGSNVGTYNVVMFPKKGGLDEGKVVASIPALRPLSPGYFHSFLMTDNYFVFIEQPLIISIPSVVWQQYSSGTNNRILKWRPQYKTRFFVVDRKSGQVLKQKYIADAFAFFHTINAYEDDGHLVVDICCFTDGKILECLTVKSIESATHSAQETDRQASLMQSSAQRFVFPVIHDLKKHEFQVGSDTNKLDYSSSKAVLEKNGSVYIVPEALTHVGASVAEMPQINYQSFNGKKYRYFYAITRREADYHLGLMKCDTVTKESFVLVLR